MWWGWTETCCVIIVWELLDQNFMQGDPTYQMSKLTSMRRGKSFCSCVLPQAEHRAFFHSSSIHGLTWPFKQTTKNRSVFLAFKFVPIQYISTHSSPQYVKFIPPSLDMFFWQGLFSEHSAVSLSCQPHLCRCFILKRHCNGHRVSSDLPGDRHHDDKNQKLLSSCIQILLLMLFCT